MDPPAVPPNHSDFAMQQNAPSSLTGDDAVREATAQESRKRNKNDVRGKIVKEVRDSVKPGKKYTTILRWERKSNANQTA